MSTSLISLPPEILHVILSNLPIRCLLSFSATCKINQSFAVRALEALELAVFPKKIHGTLAFLDVDTSRPGSGLATTDRSGSYPLQRGAAHQVQVVTPSLTPSDVDLGSSTRDRLKTATSVREQKIACQNLITESILTKPTLRCLRSLTLHLYEVISSELTATMASQFEGLQHLSLRLSHRYIHDACLPAHYWRRAPKGSASWNALAGLGADHNKRLKMRGLRSLQVDRAGLTDMQLRSWIQANPELRHLELINVRGVDGDFVNWLTSYCSGTAERNDTDTAHDDTNTAVPPHVLDGPGGCRLQAVILEDCTELVLDKRSDFDWVASMAADGRVRILSLRHCRHVKDQSLLQSLDANANQEGTSKREERRRWTDGDGERPDDGRAAEGRTSTGHVFDLLVPPRGPVWRFGIPDVIETGQPSSRSDSGQLRSVSPALSATDSASPPLSHGLALTDKIEVDPAFIFPVTSATGT